MIKFIDIKITVQIATILKHSSHNTVKQNAFMIINMLYSKIISYYIKSYATIVSIIKNISIIIFKKIILSVYFN